MAEFTVPALDLAAERLSKLFPSSDETRTLSDAEIEQVATLLEGQDEVYSQAPRAYIVLWIIGRLDILGDLLKSGFSDFCFPVESTSLPPSLDPAVRRAIVQTQHVVLTKSVDLEKGENGKHRHFGKEDPLPFKTLRRLGAGGYSQVDLIKSRISCKQYALKRIPRRTAFWNNSKQAVRQFAAEMQLIKALKHRHIVQFVGSFTDPKYLGMIISPVADMNLAEYMDLMAAQKAPPNLTSLRSFFGCLATALQYLHDQSIRHRDIKPQNILIDGGNVLFTDFGLSKDYSDHAGSTTSGVTAMTPRYSAPEVAAGDPRNTSADIWSLGCVFLEMVVVLKHHSTEWMRGYFSDYGQQQQRW
ncbi:Serine/threonine-protein kinase Nek4 [Lasiodiplodia theobromae]|uniref:Serine/threonine-protein kinase Nek4 n=1 Tax=Lasiodiplodia theobromae TaxID=45133 RepID=A0A5N5CUK1_9PEZI|nr:Serine/threonine-protein kinase Nek4 [Lasiodiplodia theobromae]